jgi:anaphase-promoting complex subunit 6
MTLSEWEFVQSLEYDKHAPHEAEFVRLMYTSRLKKVSFSSFARSVI